MRRLMTTLMSLGLALATIASAETTPETNDRADVPVPGANQAMVRVVHAAPNAEIERVVLADTAVGADAADAIGGHEFTGIEYLQATEYVPVFAGNFDILIDLEPVDDVHAAHLVETATLDTITGGYYTIVLMGLVLPTEAVGADDDFLGWLEGLFTAERQDLTLFPLVLDDLTQVALAQTEAEVRLVHAAPGTDAVDLVQVREGVDVDVLHSEAYGNWSGHTRFFPAEGNLQIRAAGSDAVIVDLGELDVAPGLIHTVIVTGTPIEDVPLRALLVSNPWIDPIATPAAPGAVAPVPGALPAAEAGFARDRIFEVQNWLATVEERLVAMSAIAEAEEQANAALQEVAAAQRALEDVRLRLETVGTPAAPAQ